MKLPYVKQSYIPYVHKSRQHKVKRPVSLHYVSQIFLLQAAALYRMNISNPALLATISADLIINGTADEIMKERETEILHCNQIVNEMRNSYIVESKLTCQIQYLLLPDYFTGKSFEIYALQAGVQVYGAERFTVGNKPADKTARISVITHPTINDLTEGIQRLKKYYHKE